jgi:PST family polysaccharide transporter
MARRMVRGGAVTITGAVVARLSGAATVIFLARHFSVDDFAAFTFGIAFATLFSTVSDLGLDSVIVRELAADEAMRDETLGSALAAKALAITASAFVGALGALFYEGDLRTAGLVGSITVLQALASTYGLTLTADLELAAPTTIRTAGSMAGNLAVVVSALAGAGPILVLAVHAAVGFLPGFALLALVQRRRGPRPRVAWPLVMSLFREAIPVAAATVAIVVFARIDQLLLGSLGSRHDVAAYGVVVRVVDLMNISLIAVSTVVLPAVSTLRHSDEAKVRRITHRANRYLASVVFPAAGLATVIGGPFLRLVFGDAFADSGSVLAVLLWAHGFAFVFVVSRQIMVATGRAGELAMLAWVAAATNVGLNLVLIPRYGAVGAAWASLLAYGAPVPVALIRRDAHHPFAVAARAVWRPAVAGVALFALTASVAAVAHWGAAAVVGLFASPVALLVTGAIRRQDLLDVTRAVSNKRAVHG